MIDPANTEPIPVHAPHPKRAVAALAVIVLFIVALVLVLKNVSFTKDEPVDITVIPPPTTGSVFDSSAQAEFTAIQGRVTSGEISGEEGARLVNELLNRAVE